ncbi:MAG: hypothetical protein J6N49_00210 [Alphaproteobacteria bacterium]|nr:hypothetical protein [Alphaproteobacteria bacterium]
MDNQEDTQIKPYKKKSLLLDLLTFFFSNAGYFGRLDYLGVVCIFSLLLEQVMKLGYISADICVYMMFFCASIAAVQKRCRDIGIKGTFLVAVFSILLPVEFYLKYCRLHDFVFQNHWKAGVGFVVLILLLCHVFLLSVPGKSEKNSGLTSPLLKYPYIYTSICFIGYLIGFYLLIQYKG